jgi:NAD(P)-dependent dehydrogenase (short-subunit alcohol dehydrogenase family)
MSDGRSGRNAGRRVTGGTGGIGQDIVAAMIIREFDVVVCDRAIDPSVAASMTANAAPGARPRFVAGDLANIDNFASLVDAYAMSKAAVAVMVKSFAIRLAPDGIAVYEVRPGLIHTPMTGVAKARFDKLLEEGFTPTNRWGTSADVGRAVATTAAGELPFTTGAAIQVDGGMDIHQY